MNLEQIKTKLGAQATKADAEAMASLLRQHCVRVDVASEMDVYGEQIWAKCMPRLAEQKKHLARRRQVKAADLAISHKVVRTLLAAGFSISIDNGEGTEIEKSTDVKAIFKALMLCDDELVIAVKDGRRFGWVRLIYGQSGWDVICDYTTNLEQWIGDGSPVEKTQQYWETRICG